MIYLGRKLNDSDRLILDNTLRKISGVVAPWFTPRLTQVVFVYYNPHLISTSVVLASVRRLGFEASLVAL